jgi:hypothetical protein
VTKAQRIVAAWANLPAPELADQVRLLVKARDAASRGVWSAVSENPVIAARVRGALAGLKAEYRGHRDEAMWLVWIAQVQQQLAAQPPAPASAPVKAARAVDVTPDDGPTPEEWAAQHETAPRPPSDAPQVLFQEPSMN